MAGRKPIFNREEQRKNQVVVPLSEQEKNQIKEAAKETDRSMASFVRMVLNEHFTRRQNKCLSPNLYAESLQRS